MLLMKIINASENKNERLFNYLALAFGAHFAQLKG